MPGYQINSITVSNADFAATSTSHRGTVMSTIGWDSSEMVAVRSALVDYWRNPGQATHRQLKLAVLRWQGQKPTEFANRDQISRGVCTRLLEDVNTPDRGRGMQSVILFGDEKPLATGLTVPRVEEVDMNVIGLMTRAAASGRGVGIVVIDLYGDDYRGQGLDRRYDGGDTVLDNMVAVLEFAKNATFKKRIEVINFVMANKRSIEPIRRALPSWQVTVNKRTMNAFDGDTELERRMKESAAAYWVIFGFNANQCVAATIFGSESTTVVKKEIIVLDGLGKPQKRYEMGWCPGALDRGFHVITSRLILASQNGTALQAREGWPNLGQANY